ncbi:hypothetical protein M9435_004794 [Picochlorum sp. BPE23]|nr:hypothetical protein M9435_004794 [Picochlorum sp. BPE23]
MDEEKKEQVQARVRDLLPRLELEQSTLTSIQESLESDLGFSLAEYKDLLRSEVDLFLRQQAMREHQKKRKAAEDAVLAQLHDAVKKQKQESKVAGFYPLSSKRYVGLKTFHGKHLVDIREFYEKDGQMMPGKTGISLTLKQWECLRSKVMDGDVDGLVNAIYDEPCSFNMINMSFEISPTKKISIVLLGGDSMGFDIREFYDSNGEMKPSKKGICLPRAQYDALKVIMGPLQEDIARLDSVEEGNEGGSSAKKESDKAPVAEQQQKEKHDAPPQGDGGPTKHALSQNRFVSLENWRGSDLINLREYYEKDGELRPGKKGISLTSPQARTMLEKIEDISQAFAQRDESFSLEISPKRKVTILIFKGTPMVNVREYYEKNGELCPGAKGLSMPEEQWTAFKAVLPNLVQSMK